MALHLKILTSLPQKIDILGPKSDLGQNCKIWPSQVKFLILDLRHFVKIDFFAKFDFGKNFTEFCKIDQNFDI